MQEDESKRVACSFGSRSAEDKWEKECQYHLLAQKIINSKNFISATYEKGLLDFGEIINYFSQNDIKIEDISTEDGDLEDVFVQLTKH